MSRSKIEWLARPGTVGETWNPIQDVRKGPSGRGYHCTKVSEECEHCWAETMNKRFGNGYPFDSTVTEFETRQDVLEQPLDWRKKRTVFVQSMGDLFHKDIPDQLISRLWRVFYYASDHLFLILTKRAKRMRALFSAYAEEMVLPNVWLGVTAGTQEQADTRIPILLQTPAVKRFVSIEPMLGPIDLGHACPCGYYCDEAVGHVDHPFWTPGHSVPIDWVIVGAETGPGKRYMNGHWAKDILHQCRTAGVPFFFKRDSYGASSLFGKEYHEWPIP